MRAIATNAEVDPAVICHHFGSKRVLFAATLDVPVDPTVLRDHLLAGPVDQLGERIVQTFLAVWDTPRGREQITALIRNVATDRRHNAWSASS